MNSERNGVNSSVVKGLVLFSALLLAVCPVTAQDVSAPGGEVFNLEYKADGFLLSVSADIWGDDKKFEKEPDFGKRSIVRGLLRAGIEEKDHVGYAWDRSEGKFYLDLNRNRDLTDDPEGIYPSDQRDNYQHFRDIRLKAAGDRQLEYVVDIDVYEFGGGRSHCNANVKSGFQGQFELDGVKWRLAVVDNMDGKIGSMDKVFLDRSDYANGNSRWDDRFSLRIAKMLTFGGNSYNTSFQILSDQEGQSLQVEFAKTEPAMGQLKLEGKFIKRLTLTSGASVVVLDSPEDSVSVPVGDYNLHNVFLDGGEDGQFAVELKSHPRVTIKENEAATLKVGGPLANSVEVKPFGRTLRLGYSLKGIGGHEYLSLSGDRKNPPKFIVKKDGKEIASGKFEYG